MIASFIIRYLSWQTHEGFWGRWADRSVLVQVKHPLQQTLADFWLLILPKDVGSPVWSQNDSQLRRGERGCDSGARSMPVEDSPIERGRPN